MTVIRPELTGRSGFGALPQLTAVDLERHVSVPEAANIKNVSPWTFRKHYAHLIRRVSPRRFAVRLRDLLADSAG